MILQTPEQLRALLERLATVAVVGASDNPERPSYEVFAYLHARAPFRVAPVNPRALPVDGVAAYPSLAAYAQRNGAPDLVDVFRKPSDVLEPTREAIAIGARAIWYQLGIVNDDAIALADGAGLDVVVNRCLKTEFARLLEPR